MNVGGLIRSLRWIPSLNLSIRHKLFAGFGAVAEIGRAHV